jgi:hypothetical protein
VTRSPKTVPDIIAKKGDGWSEKSTYKNRSSEAIKHCFRWSSASPTNWHHRDRVNRPTPVYLTRNYRVVSCPMVHVDDARLHPLGHVSATQYYPPLVVHFHNVALFDAPRRRIRRIYPQRLILVSVRPCDLTRLDFSRPGSRKSSDAGCQGELSS